MQCYQLISKDQLGMWQGFVGSSSLWDKMGWMKVEWCLLETNKVSTSLFRALLACSKVNLNGTLDQ